MPPPSLYHASHMPPLCFLNYKCPLPCHSLLSLILTWTSTMLPIEISTFTTIICLAIPVLLPFLACIAFNVSKAEQGAPDIYRQSMPMFFLQMESPLQLYQLNPYLHLQMTWTWTWNPNTPMKCPTSHHFLLCFTIWMSITQTLMGIIHNPCSILILSLKYTDSPHWEGISMFLNLHISLEHIMRR